MQNYKSTIFISVLSSLITLIIFYFVVGAKEPKSNSYFIIQEHWPEFDKSAPFLINGPLWVGFDKHKGQWKYIKIPYDAKASELQRGLIDPGDPIEWSSQQGEIGYFELNLQQLPNGTHINNRFDPSTVASKYNVDDIMIKVGNFWVDKYEGTLLLMDNKFISKYIDDPAFGGINPLAKSKTGTGFDFSQNAISVSQRRRGSSGLTYFVAEQAAINNGKHIIRNEQWQAAASGTERTDATNMLAGGETWEIVNNQDISRYGVVGCAGSLWEWTSSWGQYGEHYEGPPSNWYDWPGPGSYVEWDDKFGTYGDDIIINIAGRAYTKQDTARYAAGLPVALVRGGSWGDHNRAGIFAMIADGAPSYYGIEVGFRCVK